jgi:hypothetical protein
MRRWIALWMTSLAVVAGLTSALMRAQAPSQVPQWRESLVTESPMVISGNDIGFRIERTQDGIAVGKLVVRVDGRWVNTEMTIFGQPR